MLPLLCLLSQLQPRPQDSKSLLPAGWQRGQRVAKVLVGGGCNLEAGADCWQAVHELSNLQVQRLAAACMWEAPPRKSDQRLGWEGGGRWGVQRSAAGTHGSRNRGR